MKVLITGAAGFIGSHLAEAFLAQGDEVTGFDDLSTGREENFPSAGRLIIGDVASGLTLADPADVIYHCAASYKDRSAWERDARTNVLGTIAVVREAQRTGARLVYFQTSLCYGTTPSTPVPVTAPLHPIGSYAVSKTAAEQYIRDSGVEWVSLRLANIYGPRNLSGPVPAFYQRLAAGDPVTVVNARRDFVYIDDLVEIALRVATVGAQVYHVSSGHDVPIIDVYRAVAGAMGHVGPEPEPVPRGLDDAWTILLDPSWTYDQFYWEAKTPFETGIAAAVHWYQEHGVSETFTHLAMKG